MDTITTASADRKRDRLDRNRAKSALKHDIPPALSPHDIRAWDKAHAKRSDPRIRPEERLKAANQCRTIETRLEGRQDTFWRDRAVAETVALEAARGGQIRVRKDGGAIRELGAGLAYLWGRNRLEIDQVQALKRYADLYQQAQPSVKSILDDSQGSGEGAGLPISNPAVLKLHEARTRGLYGEPAMIRIADEVAGREIRISDLPSARNDDGEYDRRKGAALEERLRCAANLLSLYFGITPSTTS